MKLRIAWKIVLTNYHPRREFTRRKATDRLAKKYGDGLPGAIFSKSWGR